MLLSALAMLSAEIRRQPERYLFTLACGTHGLAMLANGRNRVERAQQPGT